LQTWIRRTVLLLVIAWLAVTASGSFSTFSRTVSLSLKQNAPADLQAEQVAARIRKLIDVEPSTTVLYLNGVDGGDNYYRVRYLLYPLTFVDYWTWRHPDAGGYVWNVPRFDTAPSLRHILISRNVRYIIAILHPDALRLFGLSGRVSYVLQVVPDELMAHAPLKDCVRVLSSWRQPDV